MHTHSPWSGGMWHGMGIGQGAGRPGCRSVPCCHIACSSLSRSDLFILIHDAQGRVVAVLDIDSIHSYSTWTTPTLNTLRSCSSPCSHCSEMVRLGRYPMLAFLLVGCAQVSELGGGPKDTEAPRLVRSIPNRVVPTSMGPESSLNSMNGFEPLVLDPLLVSPPLTKAPTVRPVGPRALEN